jgi:hypothetical protein
VAVRDQGGPAWCSGTPTFDRALAGIKGRPRTCIDGTRRTPIPADWLETGPDGADDIDLTRDRYTPT